MLSNNLMDNINKVIQLTKEYFGENVTCFFVTPEDNELNFAIECLVYRSFLVRFTLGDVQKGGVFGIDISIGEKMFNLEILIHEDISIDFTDKDIRDNLKILDNYLQWRMTDSQKSTFGIL